MIIIVFGILKANIDFFILPANSVKYLPDTKRKSNIILTGVISEIPDYDSISVKLLLRTGEIFTGKDTIFAEGIIAVTVSRNTYSKSVSAPPVARNRSTRSGASSRSAGCRSCSSRKSHAGNHGNTCATYAPRPAHRSFR